MKATLAERVLIEAVRSGEWAIDTEGRIWREQVRLGGGNSIRNPPLLAPCKRRRAERKQPDGYLMLRLSVEGRRVVGFAHRLVWQALRGDIPNELQINHRNGVKDDNRIENLELTTASGNVRHAYSTGLKKGVRGDRSNLATLSSSDVDAIRTGYLAGHAVLDLAQRFGCSEAHAYRLISGERRQLSDLRRERTI